MAVNRKSIARRLTLLGLLCINNASHCGNALASVGNDNLSSY